MIACSFVTWDIPVVRSRRLIGIVVVYLTNSSSAGGQCSYAREDSLPPSEKDPAMLHVVYDQSTWLLAAPISHHMNGHNSERKA
jgi:hypothetical protein